MQAHIHRNWSLASCYSNRLRGTGSELWPRELAVCLSPRLNKLTPRLLNNKVLFLLVVVTWLHSQLGQLKVKRARAEVKRDQRLWLQCGTRLSEVCFPPISRHNLWCNPNNAYLGVSLFNRIGLLIQHGQDSVESKEHSWKGSTKRRFSPLQFLFRTPLPSCTLSPIVKMNPQSFCPLSLLGNKQNRPKRGASLHSILPRLALNSAEI